MSLNITDILNLIRQYSTPQNPIYLIGGALRDRLLGISSRDLDFAVMEGAIQLGRRIADVCQGEFYLLDEKRGTARVLTVMGDNQKFVLDFADIRGNSLEQDLQHRDFTINAMAVDINSIDEIIDPLNGRQDFGARILRECSSASFREDPLRVLRAIRFSNELGFSISSETILHMQEAISFLPQVSIERYRDEIFYILDRRNVSKALACMQHYGIFPFLLPELEILVGFTQTSESAHDAWGHTLAAIDYCETMLNSLLDQQELFQNHLVQKALQRLRPFQENFTQYFSRQLNSLRSLRSLFMFAVLYHDVGKPTTRSIEPNGEIKFINHERTGADLSRRRAVALKLSKHEADYIEKMVRNHMIIHVYAKDEKLEKKRTAFRYYALAGMAGVSDCLFSLADLLAAYEHNLPEARWDKALEMCETLLDFWFNHFSEVIAPTLLLNGNDVMAEFNLIPNPMVGSLLAKLKEEQAAGIVQSREQAFDYIRREISKSSH